MKTILITGASSGLGIELSKYLLNANYKLVMTYFNNDKEVNDLVNKYKDSISYKLDITKEYEVKVLKEYLDSKNIKIDGIVNNIGIDNVSPFMDKHEESFIKLFKVNTLGAFYIYKYFGSEINNISGHVVDISSDNVLDNYEDITLEYDISKAGLLMLTKEMVRKYNKAHINTICFGWLDTKQNNIDEDAKKFYKFVSFEDASKSIEELLNTEESGKVMVVR